MKIRFEVDVEVDELCLADTSDGEEAIPLGSYVRSLGKELNSVLDGYTYVRYPTMGFRVLEIKEVTL